MAFVRASLVLETTTTTGTGTLTLAGAKDSNWLTFAAQVGEGNTCAYAITASNGQRETGVGTVVGATLERTTLIASSTGAKLDLPAGTHEIGGSANSASFPSVAADIGAAKVVTQSGVPVTTADVTGVVNTHALCTIANLTGDRYYLLPAGTAGDKIFITSLDGDDTYKLGIKGDTSITINGGSAATLDVWLQSADRTFGYEATSSTNWQRILGESEAFELVCSADSSEATTGTDKARFVMPYGFTPKDVFIVASKSAPTGSSFIMDVNSGVGGTTLFSTRPAIDATETSSLTGTAAVLNVTWIPKGTIVSVDFDQVGSTLGGKGLIMTLIGVRA